MLGENKTVWIERKHVSLAVCCDGEFESCSKQAVWCCCTFPGLIRGSEQVCIEIKRRVVVNMLETVSAVYLTSSCLNV